MEEGFCHLPTSRTNGAVSQFFIPYNLSVRSARRAWLKLSRLYQIHAQSLAISFCAVIDIVTPILRAQPQGPNTPFPLHRSMSARSDIRGTDFVHENPMDRFLYDPGSRFKSASVLQNRGSLLEKLPPFELFPSVHGYSANCFLLAAYLAVRDFLPKYSSSLQRKRLHSPPYRTSFLFHHFHPPLRQLR